MLSLLAVICPPLAVLAAGRPTRVPASVGLTALLYVPGVVHALFVVDELRTERRNEALMRAAARYA